jgi:TM2 domain-containing membrane protein YozV
LSYNVFLGLSVLGGFLALDHLYLRSPLTFVAKLIVNMMFLGVWWLYDASQAVFNTDVVKVYGLSVPGLGPKGIGAGVLAKEVPDKKHMSFFYYAVALMFGGMFGLDSFLVGDQQSGFIRLICTITVIFSFVSVFWWFYNAGRFLFKTRDVTDQYADYFGAPSTGYMAAIGSTLLSWFPFLDGFIGPTIHAAASTAAAGLKTIDDGLIFGKTVVGETAGVVKKGFDTAGEIAKAATSALQLGPQSAALSDKVTQPAVQQVLKAQEQAKKALAAAKEEATKALRARGMMKGGADAVADTVAGGAVAAVAAVADAGGILPYVFVGTIGLIAVSGMVVSFLRSRQNGSPRKDDAPPEPGVLRKPDQEKSSRSA